MDRITAEIGIENSLPGFDMLFSYTVPPLLVPAVSPGVRVMVPFGKGNSLRQGFVFRVYSGEKENSSAEMKEIYDVLDDKPILNTELLQIALFIKERTFCTYFLAAKSLLPGGMTYKTDKSYRLSKDYQKYMQNVTEPDEIELIGYIKKNGHIKEKDFQKFTNPAKIARAVRRLTEQKIIENDYTAALGVHDAGVKKIAIDPDTDLRGIYKKLTPAQRSVIDFLMETREATGKEISYYTGASAAVINNLIKKKVLVAFSEIVYREPLSSYTQLTDHNPAVLSAEQQRAFEVIHNAYQNNQSQTVLLYGVTGSGKTLVYSKLIEKVLADGKNAIVLVPEISLTPQTVARFRLRFGKYVAVLHSGLAVGERYDEYKRIRDKEARVVIGTRSAIFAPLENIGVVIMDEEQEHTYKSEQAPRYNAKDIARFRCSYHGALLVLASATPSMESYAKAQSGAYVLCELTKRFGTALLPEVQTVDMTDPLMASASSPLSIPLENAIKTTLQNKEQAILLVNRRGYNTFVVCAGCKHVITCPACSISLTYHAANNRLMCHYCGYSEPFREVCPVCGEENIRYSGYGTQRIEQELNAKFPSARILRMDADTTAGKNAHDTAFAAFAKGEYDIMVGTQMVAKGLDFCNVTLVGVVSADKELYNDSYKSAERTFDLITQVVGRAGRGEKMGKAIIQTVTPDNAIIELAAKQDYKGFYQQEINVRKALIYPPYCDICAICFSGENADTVYRCADEYLLLLKQQNGKAQAPVKMIVLGPIMPKVSKINNQYRYKLMIKCKNSKEIRQLIEETMQILFKKKEYKEVSIFADMNPENTD